MSNTVLGGQLRPGLLGHHVRGVPARPVRVALAAALLVLAVGGLRTPQRARQFARGGVRGRGAGSTRPGSRVVISCSSQVLPSGSLNVASEL